MKTPMTATMAMTYGTRRLKAGDEFVASRRDAHILARIGRAEYATRVLKADDEAGDLKALRAEYEQKMGKRPFHGWDAETLKAKMAEADQS